MKIQCSCGAKYAFDVTPEMGQNPIRFVCPTCGLDGSETVNQLIRQELARTAPASVPSPAPAPIPVVATRVSPPAVSPAPPPPAASPAMRVRIHAAAAAAADPAETG